MKKYLIYCAVVLLFLQCEKPIDCVKSSGPVKSKIFEGFTFTKLLVNKRISVVITQSVLYKVEVQAGENLINDIEVKLSGDLLTLSDNTSCNWVRDYGETVVYITAPNITDIFSKSEQKISSNGVLTYPNLHLVLMDDGDGFSGTGTGDFQFQLNNDNVLVENNEVGRFFLSGTTNNLQVSFYEGGGVFHGENLYANHIGFYHRGSNDMYIRPILSLNGNIYNVGDVNCYSRPPAENVQVQEYYRGRLIYR